MGKPVSQGRHLAEPFVEALDPQPSGWALARNIVRLKPIAAASVDEFIASIGPALQRYVTADILASVCQDA